VPTGLTGSDQPNRLRIGIGLGSDQLRLDINITGPGDPFEIDPVTLKAAFGAGELGPYGEVLKGIVNGDQLMSVRGDTAVECWRILEPVQKAWGANAVPLHEYEAGSPGPDRLPLAVPQRTSRELKGFPVLGRQQ
jgi:glucose-6-phosphate 1-dehydrogenase